METFPIIPATSRWPMMLVVFVVVIMLGVTTMMILTARGASSSRFELSSRGLRIRGDLYGRLVPLAALRTEQARIVDLRKDPDLAPRWRRMGTAVPGYRAGWFRLRNGERALLYVTDPSHAVYVPTTEDYSVIVTPREPERFLDRLRSLRSSD